MWKRIKFYTILGMLIALGGAALYYRHVANRQGGAIRLVLDGPAIVQQIQKLNELVTVKYNIQKVVALREEKVPFGAESVMLLVQANVLGGLDLSTLKSDDVRVAQDHSVTVRLPEPRIMHVFLNERETQVWDRKLTWWTPWVGYNPQLEQKARLAALESIQVAVKDLGILSNAQANAEANISELLRTLGFSEIKFERSADVQAALGTP
jgi:hypothetical protein